MPSTNYLLCSALLISFFVTCAFAQFVQISTGSDKKTVANLAADYTISIEVRDTNMNSTLADTAAKTLAGGYALYDTSYDIAPYLSSAFKEIVPEFNWQSLSVCGGYIAYTQYYVLLVASLNGVEADTYLLFSVNT